MWKRITTYLAIAGILFAIYIVATARQDVPAPEPSYPPSVNPFGRGIVALGIVEPATRSVAVAPPEPGRVQTVHVEVGAEVSMGDPLFTLDTSLLESELVRARGLRDAAAAELARQESWPRPEDIPPLRAAAEEARSIQLNAEDRLSSLEKAAELNAVNPDELARQRFAVVATRARTMQAESALARLLAGPWTQDVEVARANLKAQDAHVEALRMQIERLTTRAPIDGTVLKRDIEPGEFVQPVAGAGASPGEQGAALVIGNLNNLRVRAQVDEEDTPLLRKNARAVARVRGPYRTELDLNMLWVEPLARAKRQITNAPTELIDTRVVDVMFEVVGNDGEDATTLYPGQVVDVYIDAADKTVKAAAAPTAAAEGAAR